MNTSADMITFADYISSIIKTFITAVYGNIQLNIGGTYISLLTILLSALFLAGIISIVIVLANRS